MIETPDIERPPKELIEGLAAIGSATASGELSRLGIRDPQLRGPVARPRAAPPPPGGGLPPPALRAPRLRAPSARPPGAAVVGPALPLQFMPKREPLSPAPESPAPERQLHRHVLYHTRPGDVVVVD